MCDNNKHISCVSAPKIYHMDTTYCDKLILRLLHAIYLFCQSIMGLFSLTV